MSHSKYRGTRSACGERREAPSSTHLGRGGKNASIVRGRPGLLHRIMGRSHWKVEQSELAKEGRKGLCSDVSELTIPRSDQAEAAHCLQGYHRGNPVSGVCLGCLTAWVPSNLRFSESVNHV